MNKYIKIEWPESQEFMIPENKDKVYYSTEEGTIFISEEDYFELKEKYPKIYNTNLGEIICNKDYAIVDGWSNEFYYDSDPKKGDILLLYVHDSDEWQISKCISNTPGFPLLVEDDTLLIGINCELIGSYDPNLPF